MKTSPSLRWRTFLGAFVALLCLAPSPSSRAADPQLAEAISAYENFEYEQALKLLTQVGQKAGLDEADRARVHLFTGLTLFTLGERERAEQAFAQALRLDYQIAPPADTSPKIIAAFQAVKKTIPAPAPKPDPRVGTGDRDPDPPPTVVAPAPSKGRVWTWVVAGVGAAALAGGGLSAGLAAQAKGDFDDQEWAARAADLKETVETRALAANVLFGVGGAALLTAVVLFFVEDTGPTAPETSAAWRIDPGPLGVSATIKF
jgi:tetratricopeptide (TPR) repeat protein